MVKLPDASINMLYGGNCNAYTGMGDPYLPFREILELLTGDIEGPWCAGAMRRTYARRLWHGVPHAVQAVSYTHLTLPTSDLVEISVVAGYLKKKEKKEKESCVDDVRSGGNDE